MPQTQPPRRVALDRIRSAAGELRRAAGELRRAGRAAPAALRTPPGRRFALLLVLVCALAVAVVSIGPDRQSLLRLGALVRLGALGDLAPMIAVAGSAVLAAAVVPRTLLALVGGVLFGWVCCPVFASPIDYMLL